MNKSGDKLSTFAFLFTDVVGSTKLLYELKEKYSALHAELHNIIRENVDKFKGKVVDTAGDGFFCVFDSATEAVSSAIEIMKCINRMQWPDNATVKIRTGIHTGEAKITENGYVGYDIHIASRIMSSGHGGQILLSDTAFNIVKNNLISEADSKFLGEYNLKDLNYPQKIYQINYAGSEIDYPELNTATAAISNLPSDIVKLIGREKDIDYIISSFRNKERMITITGPGGMGKTSLALNVCQEMKNEFNNGVYYVDLSSVFDISLVAESIAFSMNLNEKYYSNESNLTGYLKTKNVLLLLDNFEQISGTPALIVNMLSECPELKLLITSRIPLNLKFEKEYSLSPLSLPNLKSPADIENLMSSDAIKLFIDRAVRVLPAFKATDSNASAIAAICIQLDGIPLAIELACARLKLFTPQQLLQKLNDKLNLLKGNQTDRPERHQTLRNTIMWSFELLSDKEKRLFELLAVFTGGCSFDAVSILSEGIIDDENELMDTMQNLIEKSLVLRRDDESENLRCSMFETIKEFAFEKLSGQKEFLTELFRKHSDYYLALSEEAEKHLTGKDLKHWLDLIESDLSNIRTALSRAETSGDTETALKFCASMWRFWIIRGNLNNDYKLVKNILSMPYDDSLKSLRAKVLNGIGTIVHELSDYKTAYPLIKESLNIYKELNDNIGILFTLANLSWVSIHLGELEKAKKMMDEIFELNKNIQDKRASALFYNNLGWMKIMQGDFLASKDANLYSLKMRKLIEDKRGTGFVLTNIAWADTFMGNYDEAENNFLEAIEIIRNINDKQLLGWIFTNFGFLELCRMKLDSAEYKLTKALELMEEVYNEWGITYELLLLAVINYFKSKKSDSLKVIEKCLNVFKISGSRWGFEKSLIWKSVILIDKSNYKEAFAKLIEALDIAEFLHDKYGYIQIFENIALIMKKMNQQETSLILLSSAFKLRNEIHTPISKSDIHIHGYSNVSELKEFQNVLSAKEAIHLIRSYIANNFFKI